MGTTTSSAGQHVIRVSGMTCAACERRVTKAIERLDGVRTVTADARHGRVTLTGVPPTDDDLRAALDRAGYQLGAPRWFSHEPRVWGQTAAAAVAVAALITLAVESGITRWAPDAGLSGPVLAVLVGLAAGVSTCMALVGGLVLAVSAATTADGRPDRRGTVVSQLVFTAGRWAGFAIGGAALGAIGSAARLPDRVLGAGVLLAAVVMALLGVRLTGVSPRVSGWTPTLPRRWAARFGTGTARGSGADPGSGGGSGGPRLAGHRGAMLAGAGTFLLPCGFTQAMQLYAISLGSPVSAAVTMTAFAVGTTPGLLGLGLVGGLTGGRSAGGRSAGGTAGVGTAGVGTAGVGTAGVGTAGVGTAGGRTGRWWPRLVGVLVLSFAVINAGSGLRVLGVSAPWTGLGSPPALAAPTTVSPNVRVVNGAQVVTMTQSADGYTPADTVVWAGMPIHWTIDVTDGLTCSTSIRIPSLGVSADLPRVGRHVVELPALPVGNTPFRCVMAMYWGSFRAIPRPGA
jgi:sulfite exporter TauE/SafE/copper chaperone CopZ